MTKKNVKPVDNIEPTNPESTSTEPANTEPKIVESNKTEQIPAETAEQLGQPREGFTWDPVLQAYIPIEDPTKDDDELSIAKPDANSRLEKFKSKRKPSIGNVQTLLAALPILRIADADDFVRFHPNEELYWSTEMCFVTVPIQGQKRDLLHLIDEELAMSYLPSKKIKRFRLALATKPYDRFFLGIVPSQNLDNMFNQTALKACQEAKTYWVQATSRREEGADEYKIGRARNQKFVAEPKWPSQTLDQLIDVTFSGRMIEVANHPALLRLLGDSQSLA